MASAIEGGVTVSPKQLKTVLEIAFRNKFNTIIAGPPGSGKSDIERQVAESIGYRFISSHPSIRIQPNTMALVFLVNVMAGRSLSS
jgi:MoxR-like ATPase